jgi:hypothetical protein
MEAEIPAAFSPLIHGSNAAVPDASKFAILVVGMIALDSQRRAE